MWWKKKVSEVSTSEDDLDSSGEEEEEEEEVQEGPTLVTVDDGRGGVKHIKVRELSTFETTCHIDICWNQFHFSWTILLLGKMSSL